MDSIVPITGRQLTLPEGPIFNIQRADQAGYVIGAFREWAGYKDLVPQEVTNGLLHFQHVLSFAESGNTGRTGIHGHFAHAHIIIPTSGRGVFSYDGVVTEAVPGSVIVQHGGTIHDQFEYTYAARSEADNRKTPQEIDPLPPNAEKKSFGFLELFVPRSFANVEVIPPNKVTETDQRTAWDHPYHEKGARFSIQYATSPGATYHPVVKRPDLEARDAETFDQSGGLVATWIIRPSSAHATTEPVNPGVSGEKGGVNIFYMIKGSAKFLCTDDGKEIILGTGDTLTHSQGTVGYPFDCSPDMRLICFFIAAKAEFLRERTPDEIQQLESLGSKIITRHEVRPEGDTRPVNFLRQDSV